jgi:hypothetical protein
LFLLYPADVLYHIVPKSLFASPALLDEFRAVLVQRVGAAD